MANNSEDAMGDLARFVHGELCAAGMEPKKAAATKERIVDWISQHWGGDQVYLPNDATRRRSQRNAQILAEFNGKNHRHLAQQHGITVVRVRQILRESKNHV